MKRYLISLDKDQHRRELFFAQANTQDFEIFSAINTMNLEWAELAEKFNVAQFQQHYGRAVTKGEIGCTLSHLAIYQQIAENDQIKASDYVFICEDDALFQVDFQAKLTALCQQKLTADFILLGQSKIADFNHFELEINYPTTLSWLQKHRFADKQFALCYPYKNYFAGTVAYLIRKSAATKIVEQFKTSTLPYWLADDFILFGNSFQLDIQIIRPLLVIENPILNSNLQATRGSEANNFIKKAIKYPAKKLLAIKRNLAK